MEIRDVTNVLFIKNNKVLLGYKKRGFGKKKYNGFGGKLKSGETIEMAAIREAKEEAGLTMKTYYKAAEIDFAESYPLRMHLYVCTEWSGEITNLMKWYQDGLVLMKCQLMKCGMMINIGCI